MSAFSSGRPISEKMVDLHVFIVPVELFLEKYRTAFNNIALESVSAGFVRVPPNDSIDRLRDHIEEQLGFDIVPEDFVYLRSVGRCMAVVKENQEQVLNIKDFLPPVAFAPEIFLLPATHDSIGRPASDVSDGVVCTQGHTTAGLNSVQPQTVHFPKIQERYPGNPQLVTQQYNDVQHVSKQESINSSRDSYQSDFYDHNGPYHQISDGERGTQHFLQNSYDYGQNQMKEAVRANDMRSTQEHIVSENNEVKIKRKSKRQQRTKKKNDSFDSSDGNSLESSQDLSSKAKQPRSVKFVQPEVVSTLSVANSGDCSLTPPSPVSSGNVVSDSPAPKRIEETERDDTELKTGHLSKKLEENEIKPQKHSKSSKKKNKPGSRSPSNERPKDVDNHQDSNKSMIENSSDEKKAVDSSKYCQFPSPLKGVHKTQTNEIEMVSGNGEDFAIELYNEAGLWGTEQAESLNSDTQNSTSLVDQDECCSEEVNNFKVEKMENTLQETENLVSAVYSQPEKLENIQLEAEKLDNRFLEADEVVSGSAVDHEKKNVAKIQSEKKENSKKKKKSQQDVEHVEKKFEIPKMSTPPPIKLPVKSKEELEKDTASDRDRKQQEVERLQKELKTTILVRTENEKHREHLVKKAKNVQTETLQKRTQSKNVWKKRFFDEKRKTQPLEEQVNRLRTEVDTQHKVLMSFLEKKNQESSSQHSIHKTPSENTNQRLLLARLQHEVEDLGRRVEETKSKLASEMKLRDQAQKELKQLRKDVMDKKINVTLNRKSQKSLQTYMSAENIKV